MENPKISVEVDAQIQKYLEKMGLVVKTTDGVARIVKKTGDDMGAGFSKGSNQAAFALQNLGRVAQDAPFGFIAIQNNLNPLLESFQQLKAETGSAGAAFKALGSTLMGPAGIGIALSVVSSAILLYQMYIRGSNKETKEATDKTKELADSILTLSEVEAKGRENASKDLSTLQQLYKATQDLTVPQKERLKIAEQLLEKYPKYLEGFSAEEILAGKAATAYEKLSSAILAKGLAQAGAENRQKLINQQLELNIKLVEAQAKALEEQRKPKQIISGEGGDFVMEESAELFYANKNVEALNKSLKENAKQITLIDQVTSDLIKKNGGGILDSITGDDKKTKEKVKDVKTIADVFKALAVDLKQAKADITGTFGDRNTKAVQAYNTAIKELIEIGIDPASMAIQTLSDKAAGLTSTLDKVSVVTKLDKSMRFMFNVLPEIAEQAGKKSTDAILSPLQAFNNYIGTEIFPQLQNNFQTFFNDILQHGKLSFESLGKAILNTLTSVLASEAAAGILNLLNPAQTQLQTGKGGGLFKALGGLIGGGAAGGGALLPIIAGVGAIAGIASLFKKRDRTPYTAPVSNGVSQAYNNAVSNGGTVVFEIYGTKLIGVLNNAGYALSRVQNRRG